MFEIIQTKQLLFEFQEMGGGGEESSFTICLPEGMLLVSYSACTFGWWRKKTAGNLHQAIHRESNYEQMTMKAFFPQNGKEGSHKF